MEVIVYELPSAGAIDTMPLQSAAFTLNEPV